MTKSTQRARHASKAEPIIVRQRKNGTTAGVSGSSADVLCFPPGISPEEILKAVERLRGEAKTEIERLIDFLDLTDAFEPLDVGCDEDCKRRSMPEIGYYDEREASGDEEPDLAHSEDGQSASMYGVVDGEFEFATTETEDARGKYAANHLWGDGGEPVLGSCEESPNPLSSTFSGYTNRGSQIGWADGNVDDREGDGCADDREDVCEDEAAEHDGAEPSLGWTVDGVIGNSDGIDREAGGSSVTEAHRQRYKTFDRYPRNRDGKHVDSQRSDGHANRRLTNLSDRQHAAMAAHVNPDEVLI